MECLRVLSAQGSAHALWAGGIVPTQSSSMEAFRGQIRGITSHIFILSEILCFIITSVHFLRSYSFAVMWWEKKSAFTVFSCVFPLLYMLVWLWWFSGLAQQCEHHKTSSANTGVRRTIGWVTAGVSCSHTNFSLSESLQTPATSTTGGSLLGTQRDDTPALCVICTLLSARLKQLLHLAQTCVSHSNGVQPLNWVLHVWVCTGVSDVYGAQRTTYIKISNLQKNVQ